jgi:hypothetical protein
MSLNASTLCQARESLIDGAQQRIQLLGQIRDMGRKIVDLEKEVQKQASARYVAEQQMASLKQEVEALRSQIPDDATVSAYNALEQFLAAPAQEHPAIRLAA